MASKSEQFYVLLLLAHLYFLLNQYFYLHVLGSFRRGYIQTEHEVKLEHFSVTNSLQTTNT